MTDPIYGKKRSGLRFERHFTPSAPLIPHDLAFSLFIKVFVKLVALIGIFTIAAAGMVEVDNPSRYLLKAAAVSYQPVDKVIVIKGDTGEVLVIAAYIEKWSASYPHKERFAGSEEGKIIVQCWIVRSVPGFQREEEAAILIITALSMGYERRVVEDRLHDVAKVGVVQVKHLRAGKDEHRALSQLRPNIESESGDAPYHIIWTVAFSSENITKERQAVHEFSTQVFGSVIEPVIQDDNLIGKGYLLLGEGQKSPF